MVEQIAQEFADQPVIFLEYDVDNAPFSRKSRYYASDNPGSTLPLVIVDSGNQASNGRVDFENVYKGMVNTALVRPPQAEMNAVWQRVGDKVRFFVEVKNLSGVTLSTNNSATIHAIVYEETKVQETGRFVRAAALTSIQSHSPNATLSYELETSELADVNWSRLRYIVLVDYRPGGLSGPYDMLQAAFASPTMEPLTVTINQGLNQLDPTDATPIAFDVVFSKPVEGFSGGKVVVSGTAPGEKTVVVQGSGSVYTAHVTGMTGSGTVIASIPAGVAEDSFGNLNVASTSIDSEVTYEDPIPKVLEIKRVDDNPTTLATVNYLVNFSEAVYEIDLGDFELSTTGDLSNMSVTSISGSGSSRIVSVNTGIGSGTLRLDIAGDAEIYDNLECPLMDLPFDEGEVYDVRIESFADVPLGDWAWLDIEILFAEGLTDGYPTTPLTFGPEKEVTRAEMAKFILQAINGGDYEPDLAEKDKGVFADVDYENEDLWYLDWVDDLYAKGLTDGCNPTRLEYCPDDSVTRAEMAKFLLVAINEDPGYVPELDEEDQGVFEDVDYDADLWYLDWIDALYKAEITTGCNEDPLEYCPEDPVLRKEIAAFLVRAFDLGD